MKRLIVLFFAFSISFVVVAQEPILVSPEDGKAEDPNLRSLFMEPSVTLDSSLLTISYPLSTESVVVIVDQCTQAPVYSNSFIATRSLFVDLAAEGLEEGLYQLRVYAFGKWWIGEFVLVK